MRSKINVHYSQEYFPNNEKGQDVNIQMISGMRCSRYGKDTLYIKYLCTSQCILSLLYGHRLWLYFKT